MYVIIELIVFFVVKQYSDLFNFNEEKDLEEFDPCAFWKFPKYLFQTM